MHLQTTNTTRKRLQCGFPKKKTTKNIINMEYFMDSMAIVQCCMCRFYGIWLTVYMGYVYPVFTLHLFLFFHFFFTQFKTHTQENKARRLPTERTKRCDFRMQLPALFAILSTDLVFLIPFWLLLLLDSFFLYFTFRF